MTHSVDLAGEEGGHVVQVVVDAPHLEGSGLAIGPVVWIKNVVTYFSVLFALFKLSGVVFIIKVLPSQPKSLRASSLQQTRRGHFWL